MQDEGTFFKDALVYLSAAVVSVPLAKRLGLGSVLGYLLAGIAIGPAVLGLLGDETHDVMHFAEFGVVMMLFLIGLELRPSLLWRLRGPIFGLGGAQVVGTAVAVTAVLVAFVQNWQQALAVGGVARLGDAALRGQQRGAGGAQVVLLVLAIQPRDHLAGRHAIAHIDRALDQPAVDPEGEVHGRLGLDSAGQGDGVAAGALLDGKHPHGPDFRRRGGRGLIAGREQDDARQQGGRRTRQATQRL